MYDTVNFKCFMSFKKVSMISNRHSILITLLNVTDVTGNQITYNVMSKIYKLKFHLLLTSRCNTV